MVRFLESYYAYDGLRGDGYAVRFARLNMLTTNISIFTILCWAIEVSFALAFYSTQEKLSPKLTFIATYATMAFFATIYALLNIHVG